MKKFTLALILILSFIFLFGCAEKNNAVPAKYEGSEFLGKWYNADTNEEVLICELLADGTAIYEGVHNGTWSDNGEDITIIVKKDKEKEDTVMTGYFVISGDGFVARANEQNQHYLDEGKGELQLEIMLTENTCVDCVKKDK